MAHPAYGHQQPNNLFANPYGQQNFYQPQPRQDYDNESEIGTPYASTTRLAANQQHHDSNLFSAPDSSDAGHGSYPPSVSSHASQPYGSPFADSGQAAYPYPAWSPDRQIPISMEEIEDIFLDLTHKFGFQRDSMRNMVRLYCDYNILTY